MRDAIFTRLSEDASLLAMLPGGLYASWEHRLISRETTPDAFDEYAVPRPAGLMIAGTEVPILSGPPGAARLTFSVTVQQGEGTGTDAIDQARARVYQLLHRWWGGNDWGVYWDQDILNFWENAMEVVWVQSHISRYYAMTQRG